jgi:integrase
MRDSVDYFGGWKLAQITRKDLFAFRDEVKQTPKQSGGGEVTNAHVNRILAGLRRLFSFAVNRELMEASPFPTNPKSGLFYPEKKGFRRFYSQEQIIKIVAAADEWFKPIILTAYYTGMRIGEIRKLRWEHISLDIGMINLPNSKTLRDPSGLGQRIVMQKELIEIFRNLPERSEWVFSKSDGIPYSHAQLFKPFKKILRSLGIDTDRYSLKELRHTTGSIMNLRGADPMAIKDQLRHTDFKTTQDFYIGSDIEYQREQVEKLALERPKAEA